MKKKKTMRVGGRTFVKPDYKGDEVKEEIYKAAASGELDAYIIHPVTKKPLKVPVELVKKMKRGESVTLNDIENYKYMN